MKRIITLFFSLSCILALLTGCSKSTSTTPKNDGDTTTTPVVSESEFFSNADLDTSYDTPNGTIVFTDTAVSAEGTGAVINGTTVTVNAPGTYLVSGTCNNGQLLVDVTKEDKVHLVFNGLTLSNMTSVPVWVKSCDKVTITLADGTQNVLSDSADADPEMEPNACLYSKEDLSINGNGALTVSGNFNNGIASKDDLRIAGGTITVKAKKNGIKGKDSVVVKDGTIEVNADNDGFKVDNDLDPEKGFANIYGGKIHVTCGDDGIQATVSVTVAGGSMVINAGGQMVNAPTQSIADGCITR